MGLPILSLCKHLVITDLRQDVLHVGVIMAPQDSLLVGKLSLVRSFTPPLLLPLLLLPLCCWVLLLQAASDYYDC